MIKQANELASVLFYITSDRIGTKGDRKKIVIKEEDHMKNEY